MANRKNYQNVCDFRTRIIHNQLKHHVKLTFESALQHTVLQIVGKNPLIREIKIVPQKSY